MERAEFAAGLPSEVTSFVGRRREVSEVKSLLGSARLVTLTGTGGIGKTRVALAVAADVRRSFADLRLFELSEIPREDAAAVAEEIERVVGGRSDPPAPGATLVIIDGCDAVVNSCGDVIHRLLREHSELRVMATSRQALGVMGESIQVLPPMTVPIVRRGDTVDVDLSHPHDAVDLFVTRARLQRPGWSPDDRTLATVARICAALDGLPLAIELAAARMRSLSPTQILERCVAPLDLLTAGNQGGPPRHGSLRAALEWSRQFCSPDERVLWDRASVFVESFDLAAAEDVCADESLARPRVYGALSGLIDKSIITVVEAGESVRYSLAHGAWCVAGERLTAGGDQESWQQRHRDFFLQCAESADSDSAGGGQLVAARRLVYERQNLATAIDFSLRADRDEASIGLRIATSLWFYWNACGYLQDGRYWLGRALAANPEPSAQRAKALWAEGWYAMVQADTTLARQAFTESKTIARQVGDSSALAIATQFEGTLEQIEGNLLGALNLLDSALSIHESMREQSSLTILCVVQLAFAHCINGDHERAVILSDQALETSDANNETFARSWALWTKGLARWFAGSHEAAKASLTESVEAKTSLHDWLGASTCVEVLAWIAVANNEPERCARLLGVADRLSNAVGSQSPLFGSAVLVDLREHYEQAALDALGGKRFKECFEEATRSPTHEAAVGMVLTAADSADQQPKAASDHFTLTRRELEVSRLVADGMSNREIAERLMISRRTVEAHVEHVFTKLGYRSRTQLANWVSRNLDGKPNAYR